MTQWTVACQVPLSVEFSRQEFSRGSSWPRDWIQVSHVAGRVFTIWATREAPISVDYGIFLPGMRYLKECLKVKVLVLTVQLKKKSFWNNYRFTGNCNKEHIGRLYVCFTPFHPMATLCIAIVWYHNQKIGSGTIHWAYKNEQISPLLHFLKSFLIVCVCVSVFISLSI